MTKIDFEKLSKIFLKKSKILKFENFENIEISEIALRPYLKHCRELPGNSRSGLGMECILSPSQLCSLGSGPATRICGGVRTAHWCGGMTRGMDRLAHKQWLFGSAVAEHPTTSRQWIFIYLNICFVNVFQKLVSESIQKRIPQCSNLKS